MAVFNTIANSVKTVIDALTLGITTEVRKDGAVFARDTLPLVVISLATDQGEQWAATGAGGADLGTFGKEYVVEVAVYRANQAEIATNMTANQDYFESIKRALNKGSLSGATMVWDTRLMTNEAWEGRAFGEGGEVSSCGLAFGSAELRN